MLRAVKRARLDAEYFESYGDLGVHSLMLRDKPRVEAYWKAFQANIDDIKDKIVLDVGTGSGLLAMMAVKLGAKHVYAVEASKEIADVARKLITKNNMQDKVTVHCSPVEKLELPVQCDTLVSEWMGFYLLHEAMLNSVLFARDKFLKPGGKIYPEKFSIYVSPLGLEDVYEEQIYFQDLYGIDFSTVFAPTALESPDVTRGITMDNIIALPQAFFNLDLNTIKAQDVVKITKDLTFVTTRKAMFAGIGLWFDCIFPTTGGNPPVVLDTSPSAPKTHWLQTIIYFNGLYPEVPENEELRFRLELTQDTEDPRKYIIDFQS